MPETFTPKTWFDGAAGGTPIIATELNRLEQGVESMDDRTTALEAGAGQTLTATGDGTTDDGPSIRAQLGAAAAGTTLYGGPGKTYLVGTPLTAATFKVPSGTTSMPYILAIPSGVTLDMRGATLKLKTATDAVMVTNAGALTATPADTDVGLVNAVLDGNNVTLTSKALAMFTGVTKLRLSLKLINGTHLGVNCYNVDRCDFPMLDADTFAGNPFSFGQNSPSGQDVRDCRFGTIRARNVTPDSGDPTNMPGNSIAGVFQRCSFDLIEARSCTAGVKFEQPSADLVIGRVLTDTCGDSGGNSGFKLQGTSTSTATQVSRVTVGEIVATNQTGHGLWMEYSSDCHIAAFTGKGNMTLGTGPDVWLGGFRDTVSSINSTNAGGDGVLVRTYATELRLGTVIVRNPGQVSGAASKMGVSVPGGTGLIRSITAVDDQGTHTMTRGVDVTGTGAIVRCDEIYVTGATGTPVSVVAAGATVSRVISTGPPMYAQVRLAPATDSVGLFPNVQAFTSSGTWTKPSGAISVHVVVISGGGGGGSGRRTASGAAASGGSGGGGGGWTTSTFPATLLSATESVTVGGGGTAGAAVTVNSTDGNNGGGGSNSSFGTKLRSQPGGAGQAGNTGAATAGSAGNGLSGGGTGGAGNASAAGTAGSTGNMGAPGGGAGGGLATTPVVTAGGAGGVSTALNTAAGGAGGATDGAVGTAGTGAAAGLPIAGSGGGGGASSIVGVGGTGGIGGIYGAGGGGGGASLNGGNSGAGGVGAAGIVIVTSF